MQNPSPVASRRNPPHESRRSDPAQGRRTDRGGGHGFEQLPHGGGTDRARRAEGDRPPARFRAPGRRPARRRHPGRRTPRPRDGLPGPLRPAHRRPAFGAGARGGHQHGAPAGLAAYLPGRRRGRTGPSGGNRLRPRGRAPDLSGRLARPARLAREPAGDRRGRRQYRVHHRPRPGAAAHRERAGRLRGLDLALLSRRQAQPQALAARPRRNGRPAAAVRRGVPRSRLAGCLRLLRHRQGDRFGGAGDETFRRRHHRSGPGRLARCHAGPGPDRLAQAAGPGRGTRAAAW